MPDPLPSDTRLAAIASFENTAPVTARPPKSILLEPAEAVYKVLKVAVANFATSRCHEQIRNDICYHNLDVTIVAVGGGLPYGNLGYTHHGMEDIAIIRVLPNMTVYILSLIHI